MSRGRPITTRADRLVWLLNLEMQSYSRGAAMREWYYVARARANGFDAEAERHELRARGFAIRAEQERRFWFRMVRHHRLRDQDVATCPLTPRPLTLGPWWLLTDDRQLPPVEGWDAGRPAWHDWTRPYVTREAMLGILERQAIADEDNPMMHEAMFREAADGQAFIYEAGEKEPPVRIEASHRTPDGRPLYDLGDLGLCWTWADRQPSGADPGSATIQNPPR